MFGIAARPLPAGDIRRRVTPALLELTHLWAVQELLRAKSLLDRYAATGLTDATTLREAVVEAAGTLQVTGRASGSRSSERRPGRPRRGIRPGRGIRLDRPPPPARRTGTGPQRYRDVMHRQARELMKRSAWKEALLLWQHLHQRQLVSQRLYLDAARCFNQLGQQQDAVHLLSEAIDTFEKAASPDFLEEAGDMALAVETGRPKPWPNGPTVWLPTGSEKPSPCRRQTCRPTRRPSGRPIIFSSPRPSQGSRLGAGRLILPFPSRERVG